MGIELITRFLIPLVFFDPITENNKTQTPTRAALADSFVKACTDEEPLSRAANEYDKRFSANYIKYFTEKKIPASLTNAYDRRFDGFFVKAFIEAKIKPETVNNYAQHFTSNDVWLLIQEGIESSVANSYKEGFNYIQIKDLVEEKVDPKIANKFDTKISADLIKKLNTAKVPAEIANKIQVEDLDKLVDIFNGQGELERTTIIQYLSSLEYPKHIPLDVLISILAAGSSQKDFDKMAMQLGYQRSPLRKRVSREEGLFVLREIPHGNYEKFLEQIENTSVNGNDFLKLKKQAFNNSVNEFVKRKLQTELGKDFNILSKEFGFENFTQLTPKQFKTLIEIYKNPKNNPQKEYAIALISRDDHNGALDDNFIGTLAEKFNLLIYQIGSEKDLEKSLTNSKNLIKSKSIKTNDETHTVKHLFIFGHGSPDGIDLSNGSDGKILLDYTDTETLKSLAKFSCNIYMPACSVGKEDRFTHPSLVKTLLNHQNPKNQGAIYALNGDDRADQILFTQDGIPILINSRGFVFKKYLKGDL